LEAVLSGFGRQPAAGNEKVEQARKPVPQSGSLSVKRLTEP
jgi:hypothetical protein